ncbi:transglycosylase domain-containing protein [Gammaproteobacteria bacterium]|nr:transglycosylase domain-containing protein [Gammaproteobacteria bacterium]
MLIKLLQWMLSLALLITVASILVISSGYIILKPNLPEINLVNENTLQVPLKIFSEDGVLIGEFGEQKRRTIEYQDIPKNLKNAFLAAEDDQFFEHNGIRILSFARAFLQLLESGEIVSGGGTITMQVVRGYLLSRDQKILRKIKEIYLAFELESMVSKEEIFALYLNTIFLGNRAYGVEAAADKYFAKSIEELSLAEAALIASSAQLPSRINPIRSPERSTVRRNWILGRMYKLGYIGKAQYFLAIDEPISITKSDSLFDLDGRYIAELVRQKVISRYGLSAYADGFSVFTTIQSPLQRAAIDSVQKHLFDYDKRHGWRKPSNYSAQLDSQVFEQLALGNLEILQKEYAEVDALGMKQSMIAILREVFDQSVNLDSHSKAIVVDIKPERIIYLDDDFRLQTLSWSNKYQWARRRININSFGPKPQNFYDILKIGDLINLKNSASGRTLDQLPEAEAAFIASNPSTGAILSYQGGFNFSKSNFDRVKQSFPQAGSSFKPFIYSAAIANGYKASDTINDAPIIFEDQNLESAWRPENYTGKFYGPIRLREALIQSVNIVSIKLLRELGIDTAHTFLENFGFSKSRLAPDLSLALGSSSFSPAEMIRAYNFLANSGKGENLYFIEKIIDRNNNIIFQHPRSQTELDDTQSIDGFPWFNEGLIEEIQPFNLLPMLKKQKQSIDTNVAFITKDILREALQRGSNGRKTKILNRSDIAGKTGTTNDAISTWFSGFHRDLSAVVWVGTDDFSSLGDNEFGSSIALPIWVDFMKVGLEGLPRDPWRTPPGLSYIKVNKDSGKRAEQLDQSSYFELLQQEPN